MPVLMVEDGSVVAGANTYADAARAGAYHESMGNAAWAVATDADRVTALVRAGRYLDCLDWKGAKTAPSNPMAWPRSGVVDGDGWYLSAGTVPENVLSAQCEAALRELADPGCLAPDRERGGMVVRSRVDCIETQWADNAPGGTTFTVIEGLLSGLLAARGVVELERR